jgi:hypothetical protein
MAVNERIRRRLNAHRRRTFGAAGASGLELLGPPAEGERGFGALGTVADAWSFDETESEFQIAVSAALAGGGVATAALLAQVTAVRFNGRVWVLTDPEEREIPETDTREWRLPMRRHEEDV